MKHLLLQQAKPDALDVRESIYTELPYKELPFSTVGISLNKINNLFYYLFKYQREFIPLIVFYRIRRNAEIVQFRLFLFNDTEGDRRLAKYLHNLNWRKLNLAKALEKFKPYFFRPL